MRNHFFNRQKNKTWKKEIGLKKAQQKTETEKTEILMEKRRQKKRVLQKFKKVHFFA